MPAAVPQATVVENVNDSQDVPYAVAVRSERSERSEHSERSEGSERSERSEHRIFAIYEIGPERMCKPQPCVCMCCAITFAGCVIFFFVLTGIIYPLTRRSYRNESL